MGAGSTPCLVQPSRYGLPMRWWYVALVSPCLACGGSDGGDVATTGGSAGSSAGAGGGAGFGAGAGGSAGSGSGSGAGSGSGGSAGSAAGASTFSWTEGTPCPVARFEANGIVVGDELWVMGGFLSTELDVTRRVDIYEPSADSWRLGPELPGAETHLALAVVENDIVIAGGFVGNVRDRVTTAGTWRFRAADAVWNAGPDLPTPRAAVAAALVESELHVAGGLAEDGETDSGDHVFWDLAGPGAWTSAAPLANPRNHGGGAASDGLFFAIAGRHRWDEVEGHDGSVDAFDPVTNTWTARAPVPIGRSEIGSATVTMPDGRLHVVGGSTAGKLPSSDVLVYDPPLDRWSTLPSLPVPLKGVVAARIGARIVVTTGSPTSTDPIATTYVGCCL